MTTVPDHVGREAVRLLNEDVSHADYMYSWPAFASSKSVITVAKLLMNPPAPMTDPDEEAAKRIWSVCFPHSSPTSGDIIRATEQMRKEREAWEAGR